MKAIGDYLMHNKEKDFYYNLSYAQIKNLYWNSELIIGYVASDEINKGNNGNKDKTSLIEYSLYPMENRSTYYCISIPNQSLCFNMDYKIQYSLIINFILQER